ncbi:MAG: HAMP domain-containing histidine kinase [Thermoproteota archaeon]|nr:HAMP domain-containing histidine kinase [Thermoproteota archaeon]
MELRHLDRIQGSFGIIDGKYYGAIGSIKEGQPPIELIRSNVTTFVQQQQFLFETLWNKSIPAVLRIKQLEGRWEEPLQTKVVENNGSFDLFNRMFHNGIKVKVLVPSNPGIKVDPNKIKLKYPKTEFRELPFTLPFLIGATIIDEEKVILFEIKDDLSGSYNEAIGLTIFMDSKSIALSYGSIFDSLWRQTDLYEQIAKNQRTQQEFIQVAAHELRNPVQSLLGFANILSRQNEDTHEFHKNNRIFIKAIERNARRLKRLIELVLDLAQIDNDSLILAKESFNLEEMVFDIVKKYQRQRGKNKKAKDVEIEYVPETNKEKLTAYADKDRISQVITNLLDTTLAFAKDEGNKKGESQGKITITIKKKTNPN